MVPLILMAARVRRVRQVAGDRVVARPQPAKERQAVALRHGVVHVVAEDRPLVGELVVDADDVVADVDRVGHVGDRVAIGLVVGLGRMPEFR